MSPIEVLNQIATIAKNADPDAIPYLVLAFDAQSKAVSQNIANSTLPSVTVNGKSYLLIQKRNGATWAVSQEEATQMVNQCKVDAVKSIRNRLGISLMDAKHYAESWMECVGIRTTVFPTSYPSGGING